MGMTRAGGVVRRSLEVFFGGWGWGDGGQRVVRGFAWRGKR